MDEMTEMNKLTPKTLIENRISRQQLAKKKTFLLRPEYLYSTQL